MHTILRKTLLMCLIGAMFALSTHAQKAGVKTNFLYWGTSTPNIGVELALGTKTTLELGVGFNPFIIKKDNGEKSPREIKLRHWLIQPELRYWTCETFNGHFFGLHALVGEYNMGDVNVPIGRLSKLKDYRYEGFAYGGGLSYGYQWVMAPRWNFELNLGLGYVYLTYDKYPCVKCGTKLHSANQNYFGITKAAISVIYLIK